MTNTGTFFEKKKNSYLERQYHQMALLLIRAIIKTKKKGKKSLLYQNVLLTFLLNLLISLHMNVSLCVVAHHQAGDEVRNCKRNSDQSIEADQ